MDLQFPPPSDKMNPEKLIPLHHPVKRDFYIECLNQDDPDRYYVVKGICYQMAEDLDDYHGPKLRSYWETLINAGLIDPVYNEYEEYYEFQFLFWSFTNGRFEMQRDISRIDLDRVSDFIGRIYSSN